MVCEIWLIPMVDQNKQDEVIWKEIKTRWLREFKVTEKEFTQIYLYAFGKILSDTWREILDLKRSDFKYLECELKKACRRLKGKKLSKYNEEAGDDFLSTMFDQLEGEETMFGLKKEGGIWRQRR